ncbi:hypothetical protein JT359_00975 [Candidatus Poribacteria bacterium]|nr:hypothetical protein [Candidatus Poribacteria bacterium]
MRAVVLSDERIIEFLNEYFINMWVRNTKLRRLRDTNGFGEMPPLVRTIIENKWRRGPVDAWVISPELEAIGHVAVNTYLEENRREDGTLESENYLRFLADSLEAKLPGFGNTVLTPEQPTQQILDVFRTPEYGHQDYTVVVIDTTAFENGGTLIMDIEVGNEKAYGSFFLLDGVHKLTFDAVHKRPEGIMLDEAHDIGWYDPCEKGQMTHRFEHGQLYKLVAMGWASNEKGSINAFQARISVAEN